MFTRQCKAIQCIIIIMCSLCTSISEEHLMVLSRSVCCRTRQPAWLSQGARQPLAPWGLAPSACCYRGSAHWASSSVSSPLQLSKSIVWLHCSKLGLTPPQLYRPGVSLIILLSGMLLYVLAAPGAFQASLLMHYLLPGLSKFITLLL
jgi:hypothetical protein